MFYVYEWYISETKEIIYVGKGSKKRYLCKKHNKLFNEFIKRYKCESRIYKYYETEEQAFEGEYLRIKELKEINQCVCNIYKGGFGGETKTWNEEKRKQYSLNNCMKSQNQRERMKTNNPMKNKEYAMKNGKSHSKKIICDNNIFNSIKECAEYYNVSSSTVGDWLKKGYNTNFKSVRYYGEEEKDLKIKTHKTNCTKIIFDGIEYESIKECAIKNGYKYQTFYDKLFNKKHFENRFILVNQQPSHEKSEN